MDVKPAYVINCEICANCAYTQFADTKTAAICEFQQMGWKGNVCPDCQKVS